MKYKLFMRCGAFLVANHGTNTAGKPYAGTRLIVFDSDAAEGKVQRPRMADGKPAPCFVACPCAKAASRKHDRCFHEDDNAQVTPSVWRHVVSCKVVKSEVMMENCEP